MGTPLCFDLWAAQHLTCSGSKRLHLCPHFLPSVTAPGGWDFSWSSHAPQHLITIHRGPLPLPAPPGPSCGGLVQCLCSSVSLRAMASEHRTFPDTEKLVLAAKGLTRVALSCFVFKSSISQERHTGVFTKGMIQSLGFPLEFASKEMEEGKETVGVGLEDG